MTELTIPPEYWTGKNLLEKGVPWMVPKAIRFIESVIQPSWSVLEFGSGGSTVFFSKRCKYVATWESNPEWKKSVARELHNCDNVFQIEKLEDALAKDQYELVLVDSAGADRGEICLRALERVAPDGWLVLDNYSRYDTKFLGGWVCVAYDDPKWDGKGTLIARRMTNKEWPIFINSKDRLSCLQELLHRLRHDGLQNITIIDTGTTWKPLLEFYELEKLRVERCAPKGLPKNALWECGLLNIASGSFFIYTDCDVVPDYGCPSDWPTHLCRLLEQYPRAPKVGFGLRIDDLPKHYHLRQKVIDWERQWWANKIKDGLYEAPIDTTLAMYRHGSKHLSNALRTAGQYIARHLPWYQPSSYPTPEHEHYLKHLSPLAGHWTRFEKQDADKKRVAEKAAGPKVTP